MSQVRVSKHHAQFPPGWTVTAWQRVLFFLATKSRRIRSAVFGLPHSRLRTYLVGRCYHSLVEQFRNGDLSFLSSVNEDSNWQLFDLGTYRGREGARKLLTEWRDMFSPAVFELVEFVNPSGSTDVLLSFRLGGQAAASGITVEDLTYILISVEAGNSVGGRFFRDRTTALEAVGLSE